MEIGFYFSAAALGLGLAMDAFSLSLVNGLQAPKMSTGPIFRVAGIFALFQGLMPLLGYACVRGATARFVVLERFVPFAALFLLLFIGMKMMLQGWTPPEQAPGRGPALFTLMAQGLAGSVDALSVGFTMATYPPSAAISGAAVIALVTFALCLVGVMIGRKFGTGLSGGATMVGGLLLILFAVKLFLDTTA